MFQLNLSVFPDPTPLMPFIAAEPRAVSISQFGRRDWCAWSEWSRCAALPCLNEIRSIGLPLYETAPSHDSSFCIVTPSVKSKGVIPNAVVQLTQGGTVRSITPFRRRIRECACRLPPLTSLINFFKPGGKCSPLSEHVQCIPCGMDETIYRNWDPDSDDQPISFCEHVGRSGFNLYNLLGGVAGGVIVILFICWLARVLIKTFSRSSRVNERTPRDFASYQRRAHGRYGSRRRDPLDNVNSGRTATSVNPENSASYALEFSRSRPPGIEPPPAYKDVVRIPPVVGFIGQTRYSQGDPDLPPEFARGLHRQTPYRSHSSPAPNLMGSTDDRECGASSQPTGMRPSQTPPPSYDEIVSSSTLPSETQAEPPSQRISVIEADETGENNTTRNA